MTNVDQVISKINCTCRRAIKQLPNIMNVFGLSRWKFDIFFHIISGCKRFHRIWKRLYVFVFLLKHLFWVFFFARLLPAHRRRRCRDYTSKDEIERIRSDCFETALMDGGESKLNFVTRWAILYLRRLRFIWCESAYWPLSPCLRRS